MKISITQNCWTNVICQRISKCSYNLFRFFKGKLTLLKNQQLLTNVKNWHVLIGIFFLNWGLKATEIRKTIEFKILTKIKLTKVSRNRRLLEERCWLWVRVNVCDELVGSTCLFILLGMTYAAPVSSSLFHPSFFFIFYREKFSQPNNASRRQPSKMFWRYPPFSSLNSYWDLV